MMSAPIMISGMEGRVCIGVLRSLDATDISCFIRDRRFGKVNLNTAAGWVVNRKKNLRALDEEFVDGPAGMKTGEELGSSPAPEKSCE